MALLLSDALEGEALEKMIAKVSKNKLGTEETRYFKGALLYGSLLPYYCGCQQLHKEVNWTQSLKSCDLSMCQCEF